MYYCRLSSKIPEIKLLLCANCDGAGQGTSPGGSGNPSFTTYEEIGLFEDD